MSTPAVTRAYKQADAYMLEYGKTLRGSFIEDQAHFEAEDTNYANPFEDDWLTVITDAEAHPTDEQRKDQLEQLTADVNNEMAECRDTFQRAKRYIQKAFPNSTSHWNEFGFDDYETARQTQPIMIQFMKRFHSTAVKYTAELTDPAVNFTVARIAEIATRRDALDTANNVQEKFKKDLPVFTHNRIVALNAVWAICTDVANTGKLIFQDNHSQYQRYLLPASDEPSGTLVLSGIATRMPDASTPDGTPAVGVLVELQPHGLESITDSNGMFGYGTAPAGPANLRFTHPMFNELNMPVTIDPENPQVVNVQLTPLAPPPPEP